MSDSSTLHAALEYAARGWAVLPVQPRGKTPIVDDWPSQASCDPETIRGWWERFPSAGVGIATGPGSGLVVLDVDPDATGDESLLALVHAHGRLPGTAISLTGGGGRHYLFAHPGGDIRNSAGKLGPGLDVRGAGGFVVAPPSVHPNGREYTWDGGEPGDVAELPGWLLELLTRSPARTGNGRPSADEPIPAGQRNDTLASLAGSMRFRGMRGSEILAALRVVNEGRCQPPLDDDEVAGIAESIARYDPTAPPVPASSVLKPSPSGGGDLLAESADHGGHSRCTLARYPGRFLHTDAKGWLAYDGKRWSAGGAEQAVDRAILETLEARRLAGVRAEREAVVKSTRGSRYNISGTKALLASNAQVHADLTHFDQVPDHLNVANGVLNLRTGALAAHTPTQLFTYCLPVAYDPDADTGFWEDFLWSAVGGDQEIMEFLKVAVGYSITGHTWEEVLFYLYGPTRAGKGTFTETLLAMLGHQPLGVEADFASFTAPRWGDTQNFDLAPLRPSRFIVASESGKREQLNPAVIKRLTGGNHIRCAYKYGDHFTYRPAFKLWLVSNHIVTTDVDDDAAWARVRVVAFPTSYLGREDKTLKAKLRAPDNLPGVLAWAVQGARKWYQSGLPYPESVRLETQAHRAQQDFVAQFLAEVPELAEDPGDVDRHRVEEFYVTSASLYQAYKDWCQENGVPPKFQKAFSQALTARGFELGRERVVVGSQRKLRRVVYGVTL